MSQTRMTSTFLPLAATKRSMMVHVVHAAQHGHQKTLVRIVDTVLVVLAVMSCALPILHDLTGCDTIISAFMGHGKKSAWATWNALPGLLIALIVLTDAPFNIPEIFLHAINRIVILF